MRRTTGNAFGMLGGPTVFSGRIPTLSVPVLHVNYCVAKKEMIWTNAAWVIALMEDVGTSRNCADIQLPRESVSGHPAALFCREYSMPKFGAGGRPFPTFTRRSKSRTLVYLYPEPFSDSHIAVSSTSMRGFFRSKSILEPSHCVINESLWTIPASCKASAMAS